MDIVRADSPLHDGPAEGWWERVTADGRLFRYAPWAIAALVAAMLVFTVGVLERDAEPGTLLSPPLIALLLASVTRALGVPPTPANWSLDHFREVLTPRTFEALGRSVGLAVAAASLLVLLGGLVAVSERRRSGRATASLITLTLVLPGSTLAVALLRRVAGDEARVRTLTEIVARQAAHMRGLVDDRCAGRRRPADGSGRAHHGVVGAVDPGAGADLGRGLDHHRAGPAGRR